MASGGVRKPSSRIARRGVGAPHLLEARGLKPWDRGVFISLWVTARQLPLRPGVCLAESPKHLRLVAGLKETAAVAAEEEPSGTWVALAKRAAALAPTTGKVAGALAATAGVGAAAAVGLAQPTVSPGARAGWLFRPQQGSEDAAAQDVRSANGMNDATQPQHFTLRSGSSTSGKQPCLLTIVPSPGASQPHATPLLLGPEQAACLRQAILTLLISVELANSFWPGS